MHYKSNKMAGLPGKSPLFAHMGRIERAVAWTPFCLRDHIRMIAVTTGNHMPAGRII
jgi:hypothetical protein